jgi:hypothetical protein
VFLIASVESDPLPAIDTALVPQVPLIVEAAVGSVIRLSVRLPTVNVEPSLSW